MIAVNLAVSGENSVPPPSGTFPTSYSQATLAVPIMGYGAKCLSFPSGVLPNIPWRCGHNLL